jgi:tetratricopeptide (TPR) repeat protein
VTYEEYLEHGQEELELGNYARAIYFYELAMSSQGGPRREPEQMIGVCYLRRHNYKRAIEWLDKALDGAVGVERANILRDKAEALSRIGNLDEALAMVDESVTILGTSGEAVAYGSSLHYRAKIRQAIAERGETLQVIPAYHDYVRASTVLGANTDHSAELYCLLDFSDYLASIYRYGQSKRVALRALRLALRYGGTQHRIRALAILGRIHQPSRPLAESPS